MPQGSFWVLSGSLWAPEDQILEYFFPQSNKIEKGGPKGDQRRPKKAKTQCGPPVFDEKLLPGGSKKEPFLVKKLSPKSLFHYDLVILMTDHDCFDYKFINKNSKKIIDCRGKFSVSKKVIRG